MKITQYENHVDFDSKGSISLISIAYEGKMAIDINIEVKNVEIYENLINIYLYKGTKIKDTFFTYKGWLYIKNVTCFSSRGRSLVPKKVVDSTFQKVSDKWDETDTNTWESYDSIVSMAGETRRSVRYKRKGLVYKKSPKVDKFKSRGASIGEEML